MPPITDALPLQYRLTDPGFLHSYETLLIVQFERQWPSFPGMHDSSRSKPRSKKVSNRSAKCSIVFDHRLSKRVFRLRGISYLPENRSRIRNLIRDGLSVEILFLRGLSLLHARLELSASGKYFPREIRRSFSSARHFRNNCTWLTRSRRVSTRVRGVSSGMLNFTALEILFPSRRRR